MKYVCQKLFCYRYLIGIVIILVCTLSQLSGSSINEWNEFINDGEYYDTVLLGTSRGIRSDEWAVFTPMAFSQTASDFQYYSDVLRATPTDAFIEYGQPVRDWAVVFRPFQIGYLIGGASYGLSFYWCSRLVILLLVSIEFGYRILTAYRGERGDKILSVVYGILLTFSSFVQWWFSVNGLVEMLIFAQLALILFDQYFRTEKKPMRTLLALLISYCAVCYLFTMYPAWEIPIAYIILIFVIAVFLRHWRNSRMSKMDGVNVLLGVGFFGANTAYILYKSWDAIAAITQTVYPGARAETGGNMFLELFNYAANLFTTTDAAVVNTNVCEAASVFGLFPFNIILAVAALYLLKKKGLLKKEIPLILMLLLEAFFILYCAVGFPHVLAKLTLLYACQASRVVPIASLLNLMILIRAIQLLKKEATDLSFPKLLMWGVEIVQLVVLMILCVKQGWTSYISSARACLLAAILVLTMSMCIGYIYLKRSSLMKVGLLVLTVTISFFSGAIVNPVNQGTDAVYAHSIVKEIQAQNNENPGKWAVINAAFPIINLPLLSGAPTINCTNVYPNMELWSKLDPNGSYADIYNRYAHIMINMTCEETTGFELLSPDSVQVNLSVKDLELLGANYLITTDDLTGYGLEKQDYSLIYANHNYYIWEKRS